MDPSIRKIIDDAEDDESSFWDRFDDWSIENTFQSIGVILFTVFVCIFLFQYMSLAWYQHEARGQPRPVTFVVAESLIAEVRANTPMLNFASNQAKGNVLLHSIDLIEITPEIAVEHRRVYPAAGFIKRTLREIEPPEAS